MPPNLEAFFMFLSKSASGIYQLYFIDSISGKRRKVSTHVRMKRDAITFLRSFEQENLQKPVTMTLSQFTADFLQFAEKTYARGTYKMYKEILGKFQKFTGDLSLTQIGSRHVDMFMAERLKLIKPVSANIEFRCVKAALNTAVRWNLLQLNPFKKYKAPRPEDKSPRFFSKEDFQKLMLAIPELWLKNVVWFALFTGMRRSEIINLKWENIDFDRRSIAVQSNATFKTKAGKRRVLPISDGALVLLKSILKQPDNEYIFTLYGKQIKPQWLTHRFKHYCKKAELNELHFHHLRTSFASWLVMSGVEIFSVSKLLGHSSVLITAKHYAHLSPQTLIDEVNRIQLQLK